MPNKKLPTDLNALQDFATFTSRSWEDLDGFYDHWRRRWQRTLDFIRGDHWNVLKRFDREKMPGWKRFPVINYVNSYYTDFITEDLDARVRYSAVPEGPEPEDIDGAELMERALKYAWDLTDMEQKRIDLAAWRVSCGVAYMRWFWNTNTGNLLPLAVPTPDGGILPVNPDTLMVDPSLSQPVMVDAGDLDCEVVSPQLVRWAPKTSDGVMIGMLLTEDEAIERFGAKTASKLSFSKTHSGLSEDISFGSSPLATNSQAERALIIEHYLPKSARFPQGLWWTLAHANKKLLTRPAALPAGVIPLATWRWIPVPGHRKLGYSPLYDLTFVNKSYDERMAKILEWQNKVVPKYLLKNGGGLTYGEINDEPGQELVVNPGGEPETMEFRQAPQGFFEMASRDLSDMQTLAGAQTLTTNDAELPGQLARGARARRPIEPRSAGKTRLLHINAKAGWKEAGEIIIAYISNFYDEERIIAVQGPDKQYQWESFKGSDISNISAHIHVDEASLYPWNRQELRDSMLALLDSELAGAVLVKPTGEPDQDRINAVLEATGIDVSINALDPDVMEARNIISEFRNFSPEQARPLPQGPQFWQDVAAHHEEYIRVLKSRRFQSWPPQNQAAFTQYVQQFQQTLNQQAQEEAEAMVEQERALRQVREQAELESTIREMVASFVLETLHPTLQELLGADLPGVGTQSPQEGNTERQPQEPQSE